MTTLITCSHGTKTISLPFLQALADACDLFTGAELAGLCQEAAITALREDLEVCRHHQSSFEI